jgi:hypothetical protein
VKIIAIFASTGEEMSTSRCELCMFVVFLMMAAGCSQDSPAKRTKATASWSATAALVGQEWIRGVVPAAYTEATLRSANAEIGMLQVSETARAASARLLEAVRAGDRGGASQQARILDEEARALRSRMPQ